MQANNAKALLLDASASITEYVGGGWEIKPSLLPLIVTPLCSTTIEKLSQISMDFQNSCACHHFEGDTTLPAHSVQKKLEPIVLLFPESDSEELFNCAQRGRGGNVCSLRQPPPPPLILLASGYSTFA